VSAEDHGANLYWSCPTGLPDDWHCKLGEWQKTSAVPWLSIQADNESLTLTDDEGWQVALDLSRLRPNGIVAFSSKSKLLLGIIRIGQLLGFSLANESMEKIDPSDIGPLLTSAIFEMPHDILEDMAFAIGLVPIAFRLRHLAIPNLATANELFF